MATEELDLISCWQMPVSFEPCVFCFVISREKEHQFNNFFFISAFSTNAVFLIIKYNLLPVIFLSIEQ